MVTGWPPSTKSKAKSQARGTVMEAQMRVLSRSRMTEGLDEECVNQVRVDLTKGKVKRASDIKVGGVEKKMNDDENVGWILEA